MLRKFSVSLLAASALAGVAPAQAQDSGGQADVIAELRALRAQVEALQARVVELEGAQAAGRAGAAGPARDHDDRSAAGGAAGAAGAARDPLPRRADHHRPGRLVVQAARAAPI